METYGRPLLGILSFLVLFLAATVQAQESRPLRGDVTAYAERLAHATPPIRVLTAALPASKQAQAAYQARSAAKQAVVPPALTDDFRGLVVSLVFDEPGATVLAAYVESSRYPEEFPARKKIARQMTDDPATSAEALFAPLLTALNIHVPAPAAPAPPPPNDIQPAATPAPLHTPGSEPQPAPPPTHPSEEPSAERNIALLIGAGIMLFVIALVILHVRRRLNAEDTASLPPIQTNEPAPFVMPGTNPPEDLITIYFPELATLKSKEQEIRLKDALLKAGFKLGMMAEIIATWRERRPDFYRDIERLWGKNLESYAQFIAQAYDRFTRERSERNLALIAQCLRVFEEPWRIATDLQGTLIRTIAQAEYLTHELEKVVQHLSGDLRERIANKINAAERQIRTKHEMESLAAWQRLAAELRQEFDYLQLHLNTPGTTIADHDHPTAPYRKGVAEVLQHISSLNAIHADTVETTSLEHAQTLKPV